MEGSTKTNSALTGQVENKYVTDEDGEINKGEFGEQHGLDRTRGKQTCYRRRWRDQQGEFGELHGLDMAN